MYIHLLNKSMNENDDAALPHDRIAYEGQDLMAKSCRHESKRLSVPTFLRQDATYNSLYS